MAAAAPRAVGAAAPAARHRPAAGWFARNWKKVAIWTLVAIATLVLIFTIVPPVINWWNTSSFSVWSSDRALASARDNLSANRKVANNGGRIKAIDNKTPELIDSANTAGERAEGKTLTRQLARERAATVRDQAAEMKNLAAASRADAAETALSACDDGDDACIERALKLLRPPFMVKQEADELAAAKKAAEDAKAAQKVADEAKKPQPVATQTKTTSGRASQTVTHIHTHNHFGGSGMNCAEMKNDSDRAACAQYLAARGVKPTP